MKPIIAFAPGPLGWGAYEISFQTNQVEFQPTNLTPDSYFIPGFVDLHIHGAFGIDFMSATKEQMVQLANQLEQIGYEYFYPTTVTASFDEVSRAIGNLPSHPMIPGFHLEGPFISPEYPGAQPIEYISKAPDSEQSDSWQSVIDDPRLKRITLAPEMPNALSLIKKLADLGVQVSIGHTNATIQEVESAVDAGAKHATHTFNAMRPFHHREAGTVGAVLLNTSIIAELIYDRHHVSKESAQLLLNCKTAKKVIAVSDCTMAHSLSPNSEINMWGHICVVEESSVRLKSNGSLAGSTSTLLDCFQNLAEDFRPETATHLCSISPRLAANDDRPPQTWAQFSLTFELLAIHKRVS